jgi:P-type conjugative transfer protein TrbJ
VVEVGPNLTVNTLTSQEMVRQVMNSTQEVEMMKRNLIPGSGGSGDDLLAFLKRLDEVLGEDGALHYQLSDLKQRMAERYPGYTDPGPMPAVLEGTTRASLSTLRGSLLTVREQLKLSEKVREEAVLSGLLGASRSARGNLAVTQASNALLGEMIREQRKIRQMLGALINTQTVAITHQINAQSGGERSVNDWVERSQIKAVAYSGSGGFGPADYPH